MSVRENLRQWSSETRGVYEVWYLTWNHPETDQGFWLRYITEAPVDPAGRATPSPLQLGGEARAELWFARFDPKRPDKTFGMHRQFPIAQLSQATDGFGLTIAGSRLGHDHAVGQLAGGGHDVTWDLRWEPAAAALRLLPDVMYGGGGRGETTVVSPSPRVPLSGTLVVDGERLVFDRAIAGQTHVFGKKHAYSWTWGRCAEFTGEPDGLLEILGVRLQRRGITSPPMALITLDEGGEQHRFNQFRHVATNRGSWTGNSVKFSAWSPTVKLEGELTCTPDQMVAAPYLDPDGTEVFCSNTEIGNARVTLWKRAGLRWREHRTLVGTRRAHFEIGSRMRDPAVVRDHALV